MDESVDLEARIAARQTKKKKKKKSITEGGGEEVIGENGEVVRKKKKKKKKPVDGGEGGGGISSDALEGNDAGEGGEVRKKKKKKKKKPKDDTNGDEGVAMVAAIASKQDEEAIVYDANGDVERGGGGGYNDSDYNGTNYANDVFSDENTVPKKDKFEDDVIDLEQDMGGNGEAAIVQPDESPAYCFEADTEIMAEIEQEGMALDDAGGIQAFVADVVAIDGDDVGIIKSDAEIEKEEKKRYTKWFCGSVIVLVIVIVAIAVPVTLKFAKGGSVNKYNIVTYDPTSMPSDVPSSVPSSMPSSVRFTEIVKKLTPLSGDVLKEPGSPQYYAAMWMADDDPMRMELDHPGFEQRYIIAMFYYATDGDNWKERNGWLTGASECEWYGIQGNSLGCEGGCIERTVFEGSFDKVCRLAMGRLNNLYGEIPTEMGELTEMRWFEVQDDYLIGTIPDSLSRWTKMHTMLLGGNYLHGGFPSSFEGNDMLGTLFIDRNSFNSTFPNVLATLKNLEWLDAETNKFKGSLPEAIADLKLLRILNVNNNSLTGYLPDSWDENNLIEDFEVAHNDFKGPLPDTLASARFLKDFRASSNQLTGEIPLSYYKWEELEELYLDENNLVGELPQNKEPFYDGLQEFSIHNNGFTGKFPVENFHDTFRVKVLSLHGNDLTGAISTNICDRQDTSLAYSQLTTLTADCDKISCNCCTCYVGGELQGGSS